MLIEILHNTLKIYFVSKVQRREIGLIYSIYGKRGRKRDVDIGIAQQLL